MKAPNIFRFVCFDIFVHVYFFLTWLMWLNPSNVSVREQAFLFSLSPMNFCCFFPADPLPPIQSSYQHFMLQLCRYDFVPEANKVEAWVIIDQGL